METEGDIRVLLETILCRQHDNMTAVKDAVLTLASMCSDQDEQVQKLIRRVGAIRIIYEMGVCSSQNEDVMKASLYALGCFVEKCELNQRELTCPQVFNRLSTLLSAGNNIRMLKTLTFLIVCLVSSNAHAQTLMRSSNCLKHILDLYKIHSPALHGWLEDNQRLWRVLTVILGVCCNNPQNDDNQRDCSTIFPHSFQVLDMHGANPEVVKPITSMLGHTVFNNVYNQDRLVKCGGIQCLSSVLHRAVNRLGQRQEYSDAAMSVINVLQYVIAGNVGHAEKCGDHELVMLLLKLLQNGHLAVGNQSQIAITIVNLAENSSKNQSLLIENDGVDVLRNIMAESEDDTLTKAVQYVLKQCISFENFNRVHQKNGSLQTNLGATENATCTAGPQSEKAAGDKECLKEVVTEDVRKPTTRENSASVKPSVGHNRRKTNEFHESPSYQRNLKKICKEANNEKVLVTDRASMKTKIILKAVKAIKSEQDGKTIVLLEPYVENPTDNSELTKHNIETNGLEETRKAALPRMQNQKSCTECEQNILAADSSTDKTSHGETEVESDDTSDRSVAHEHEDEEKPVEVVPPSECSSSRSKFEREVMHYDQNSCSIIVSSSSKVAHWLNTAVTSDVEEVHDEGSDVCHMGTSYHPKDDDVAKNTDIPGKPMKRRTMGEIDVNSRGDATSNTKTSNVLTSKRHLGMMREQSDSGYHGPELLNDDQMSHNGTKRKNLKKKTQVIDAKWGGSVLSSKKRSRVKFSKTEEANLLKGVSKLGRSWVRILGMYKFNPKRTAVDLKDKYRTMAANIDEIVTESVASSTRRTRVGYSKQEEVNLLKGVERMGKFWAQILNTYKFHPSRTPVDLKDKYKRMMVRLLWLG